MKIYSRFYIFWVAILVTQVFSQSLRHEQPVLYDLKPVITEINGLEVSVDPRIELLAVVEYLSIYRQEWNILTKLEFDYRSDLDSVFAPFKEHAAVKLFGQMSRKILDPENPPFAMGGPPEAMLYLNADLTPCPELFNNELMMRRTKGRKGMETFLSALKAFYLDTPFNSFYKSHNSEYRHMVANTLEIIRNRPYIAELESYYGVSQKSYTLVLAPLFHPGGFGPRVPAPGGGFELYAIIGPHSVTDHIPAFGSYELFDVLLTHEFSHSFVNPLTEKFSPMVEECSKAFEPVREAMAKNSYGDWPDTVNEHIVRAVTVRLAYHRDPLMGAKALEKEKKRGFYYIEPLIDLLEDYEAQRQEYPTLEAFYPKLLQGFLARD